MRIVILLLICTLALSCSKQIKEREEVIEVEETEEEVGNYDPFIPFHEVEKSMEKSRTYIDKYKDSLLTQTKGSENKGAYEKALMADRLTKDFIKYVQSIKEELEEKAGRKDADIANHSSLMIEGGKGKELKNKINSTRKLLLTLLTKEEQKQVKSDLIATDPNENLTWESELFEHSPLAAVVTLLEKIKNDAANTNVQVIRLLLERAKKQ